MEQETVAAFDIILEVVSSVYVLEPFRPSQVGYVFRARCCATAGQGLCIDRDGASIHAPFPLGLGRRRLERRLPCTTRDTCRVPNRVRFRP